MVGELTLPQVIARLQVLEETVKAISAQLSSQTPLPHFEFIIRVNEREVWSGSDLETHYLKIRRDYPEAQISIGWRSSPVVLI